MVVICSGIFTAHVIIETLISSFRKVCDRFPDKRTGSNIRYGMGDIGMTAFSVFFMQSPSFLSAQRALETGRGQSNCQTLFGIDKIPTDNHIRDMLDPVEPARLFPLFGKALATLEKHNGLDGFRRLGGHILIALDGTEYHCSKKICCDNCQSRKRNNGRLEYYHSMLCATIVAPGHNRVLPLEPEFITPQDGHEKQDCENAAIKRWLAAHGKQYKHLKPVYLGDDLMSRQPICEAVQDVGANFIFTAKPSSHKTMHEWINGAELQEHTQTVRKGRSHSTFRYRWLKDIPLRDGKDAMHVNWFEIEIVNKAGKITYRNSFVTDLDIDKDNIAELAACGRARWKIENEQFNTVKNCGYHLEHNFGHGKQHLAALLATMNLLAFAFHTVCDLADESWSKARGVIGARKYFFQNLLVLTRYLIFPDWRTLIKTIIDGEPPGKIA
jgi:hypothetical protein